MVRRRIESVCLLLSLVFTPCLLAASGEARDKHQGIQVRVRFGPELNKTPLAGRPAIARGRSVAREAFADKWLMHHPVYGLIVLQQPDQGAPSRAA